MFYDGSLRAKRWSIATETRTYNEYSTSMSVREGNDSICTQGSVAEHVTAFTPMSSAMDESTAFWVSKKLHNNILTQSPPPISVTSSPPAMSSTAFPLAMPAPKLPQASHCYRGLCNRDSSSLLSRRDRLALALLEDHIGENTSHNKTDDHEVRCILSQP